MPHSAGHKTIFWLCTKQLHSNVLQLSYQIHTLTLVAAAVVVAIFLSVSVSVTVFARYTWCICICIGICYWIWPPVARCRIVCLVLIFCFVFSFSCHMPLPLPLPPQSNSCLHLIILNLICKQRPGSNNTSLNPNPNCSQVRYLRLSCSAHIIYSSTSCNCARDLVPIGLLDGYHVGNRTSHAPATCPMPPISIPPATHNPPDACRPSVTCMLQAIQMATWSLQLMMPVSAKSTQFTHPPLL